MAAGTEIASLFASIGADVSGLEKGLNQAETRMQSVAATMGKIGSQLTMGVTLPLVGIGTAAVKAAVDMDREMRNIQSISQETDAQIAGLSQTFVRMSTDMTVTTDSAVKLAQGFYTIQGSGFAGADAMKVLEASTKAASAGLTNTQVAAMAITAALNAYGESADQAKNYSDLMFKTVDIGVGTFEELAGSVGQVVGSTAQAGVGFETVAAGLATMSKAGISFSEGATAMNALIMGMIKPSENLKTVLAEMGYESGQAALNALGLSGVLGALVETTGGGTEAMANLFPNIRAVRAALSLTREEMGPFTQDLAAMGSATEGAGATQAAFEIQTKSTAAQMANLKNNLQAAAITIGNVLLPAVNEVVSALSPLIQRVSEADSGFIEMAVKVGMVAAAVGPLLIVVSKLISVVSGIPAVLGSMASAASLVVTQVGILTGASTMLGAALMTIVPLAVIAGLVLLAKHLYDNKQAFQEAEKAALASSQSYEEYKAKAIEAAGGADALSAAAGRMGIGTEQAAQGIIKTREEFDALHAAAGRTTEAIETNTRAMIEARGGYDIAKTAIEEQTEVMDKLDFKLKMLAATTKDTAAVCSTSMTQMKDSIWEVNEANLKALLVATDMWGKMKDAMTQGVTDMQATLTKYTTDTQATWDNYYQQLEGAALQHQVSVRQSEIEYQRSRAEIIAEGTAKVAALEAAGQTDKAEAAGNAMTKQLDQLDYNYQTQKAWAEWHWAIQQKMAEQAHYQRLLEMAEFAKKDIQIQYALTKATIDALAAEAVNANFFAKNVIGSYAAKAGAAVGSAKAEIQSMQAVQKARLDLLASLSADIDKYTAELDRVGLEMAALVEKGPDLPPVPDFSQWAGDYVGGLSSAGSQVKESATKVLKEVVEDIAGAFEKAMEVFEKVAGYVPPKGLAQAMEALRKDIEEAVRQLYIAYQALGKDGVEGAGLMAESASKVVSLMGLAVDNFAKVKGYGPPLLGAMDGLLADVKYLLVKVRTELLDLWGWAGERKDTVWGHMESWAAAVGGVVALVGQAVSVFTEVGKYKGIMPGAIATLVADIQAVLTEMQSVDPSSVDETLVRWAELAAGLISAVTGMVDDLETLSGLEGGLVVNSTNLVNLLDAVKNTVAIIAGFFVAQPYLFDEATAAASETASAWLELNGKMISLVVGMIDDIEKITAFEGGLQINSMSLVNLLEVIKSATAIIAGFFMAQPYLFDEATAQVVASAIAWLELNSQLISLVAGVIEDLTKVAEFKGGLVVSAANVTNLLDSLKLATETIVQAMGAVEDYTQDKGAVIAKVYTAWLEFKASLVSTLAGVIDDLAKIAEFEGGITVNAANVTNLIDELRVATETIVQAMGAVEDYTKDKGAVIAQVYTAWLEFKSSLVSTLAGVVEDMGVIARFKGNMLVSQANVENLIEVLKDVVTWVLAAVGGVADQFDESGKYVNELSIAWVKIQSELIKAMSDITEGIEMIASFKAVDESAFKLALDGLFDALYWFLEEFNARATLFAGVVSEDGAAIAKLIGDSAKGLGDAIDPLMDVAEFAVTPAEAEVAIGLFFEALEMFLSKFKEKATAFEGKVSQDIADLAQIIGDTVSGIGSAVEPLIKILEYNPEVVNIEAKFTEFFGHLASVLGWIEREKDRWVISTAAQELAAKIAEVMGSLKTAVDFLDEMGTYGEDQTTPALVGFLAFLIDLEQIVAAINTARDRVTEEALAAAAEFAGGCSQMLTHITDGINTLNSLPDLAMDFYQAGYGLGVGFIQGMIDGLVNNASALYQTVMAIVAAAIAAANEAAGAASESKLMWDLGANMVAGLKGALEAGQADVQKAMAGLVATQGMGMPAFAVAGAGMGGAGFGGAAGNAYTYNYNYNESDSITPGERASLRQDFEAIELYSRMRG